MAKGLSEKARTARRKRHVHLSDENAILIRKRIDEWPLETPLTWSDIVRLASKSVGITWTRQTLEKRKEIKDAYLRRSSRLQESPQQRKSKSEPARSESEQRILNLKAENEKLRHTLIEYDKRLIRYVKNAFDHGLTEDQLDAPLRPMR